MRYLIKKGHREIGYVTDTIYDRNRRPEGVGDFRLKGFVKAMTEAGLPVREDLIFTGDKQVRKKQELFERIYRKQGEFTALAFCYDYYAIEMMDVFHHKGIRIPEDFSIIGFDDIDMARLTSPRLTTIHQGMSEKGKTAVQQLLRKIRGEEIKEKTIRLPVSLIERETVKNPI